MTATTSSQLKKANEAFRNHAYESAILLYEEALISADEKIKTHIVFNINATKRRLGISDISTTDPHQFLTNTTLPISSHSDSHPSDYEEVKSVLAKHLDYKYYFAKYPDVAQRELDPLEHYVTVGWKEGRNPCSEFSTQYYLDSNTDVASAGINPYWHYIVAGKKEGRSAMHPGGIKAEVLRCVLTLDEISKQWKKAEDPPNLLTERQIVEIFTKAKAGNKDGLVISIGHDHYKNISGGIQLCIQREEVIASERSMLYLNVHPWQALPRLANEFDEIDPLLFMVLAGRDVGVCRASVLMTALKKSTRIFEEKIYLVVHSLLGHSIEWVDNLVKIAKGKKSWFWLHDFFTLCPSYALQRNSISYCDAPEISSNSCLICNYSEERYSHMRRVNSLLEKPEITVISPSDTAKQFWLSKKKFPAERIIVKPHINLNWHDREELLDVNNNGQISIGFVGAPIYYKGWNAFENLVKYLGLNDRYRFVYFGHYDVPLSGVESIHVHVHAEDAFSMTRAISDAKIDFVLHWASCSETFSFTTFEAIAAGAYVLTNPISGNVAATVVKTGRGAVFQDEQALHEFFQNGEVEHMLGILRAARSVQYCQLTFSDMTIPLIISEEQS